MLEHDETECVLDRYTAADVRLAHRAAVSDVETLSLDSTPQRKLQVLVSEAGREKNDTSLRPSGQIVALPWPRPLGRSASENNPNLWNCEFLVKTPKIV